MNRDELQNLVITNLCNIAPDIEATDLDAAQDIRDQYDFDSMDQLNLFIALHKATQIEIPEKDYPQLSSVNGIVDYLLKHSQ